MSLEPSAREEALPRWAGNENAVTPDDPIFKRGDAYFFWDETWSNEHGPYMSYAEANRALEIYCQEMLG